MKHIAIIYHDADFDGKLSNEVCRYHLSKLYPDASIHSYGWDYGRPVPDVSLVPVSNPNSVCGGSLSLSGWACFDAIYIVDLSVDELMARPDLQDKIIWIDHHKSAIERWRATTDSSGNEIGYLFNGLRIDGVAACRLCWQWFVRRNRVGVTYTRPVNKQDFVDRLVEEPELIRLAGEYDVWDHRDPNGKVLQFGLRACSEREFREVVQWQFDGRPEGSALLDNIISGGQLVKSYCDKQADEYSRDYARTLEWEGLTFCCLNIGQRGNSDLLRGGLKPEHQACFAWRHTGDSVMVSLYHAPEHEHLDLSLIAAKYGGGGHKGACGFRMSLKQLSEIIP